MKHLKNDDGLFSMDKLAAPEEIIGKSRHLAGGNTTTPREWTEAEITWLLEQKAKGLNREVLAEALGRSVASVQLKLKRLKKDQDTYNIKNRQLKYETNKKFLEDVKPKNILDVFGGNSYWLGMAEQVVTNDLDPHKNTNHHLDALDLLCQEYLARNKYDLIDLDPFGSAYDCLDLAIKLAKKAVIVSFGEWGHKRWKRYDFVKPRYSINSVGDYGNGEPFIKEFQRLATCNKKQATPVYTIQYENFIRVYFLLEPQKVTSQWDKGSN